MFIGEQVGRIDGVLGVGDRDERECFVEGHNFWSTLCCWRAGWPFRWQDFNMFFQQVVEKVIFELLLHTAGSMQNANVGFAQLFIKGT